MKKILTVLMIVVVIGGAAAWFMSRRNGSRGVEVETVAARKRDAFRSYVSASGEIVATRYADIGSSMMGRLVRLSVKEGDRVRAGQVLAVIDPVQASSDVEAQQAQVRSLEAEERVSAEQIRNARSELEGAEVRLRDAQKTLERVERLSREGLVPAAQLQSAEAARDSAATQVRSAQAMVQRMEQAVEAASGRIAQARAQVTRASDLLSKTQIRSPMDGVVSRLPVREGEMVVIGIQNQPGTTLMTISDLSSINAEVKVAEADVLRIRLGQSATVRLEALPGKEFAGRVVEVGASALPGVGNASSAAREFKVVVRLDDPGVELRPGLTSDTEILVEERSNATTVPLQAVVLRPGPEGDTDITGVFSMSGGFAKFLPVRTGIIGGLEIELVEGASPGTEIVAGPIQVLRDLSDGAAVRLRAK